MRGSAIRQVSTGTMSCERLPRSPARPASSTANSTRVRQPRPASSPGRDSTHDVDLLLGQPGELLADHGDLELALMGDGDVLEVAAAAPARAGIRARRGDPVRAGLEHLHAVGPDEPLALTRLGDLGVDPLTGQRVADEDDPALVPRDAEPAVGHRAHLEGDDVADGEGSGRGRSGGHCPRRTEPAVGPSNRSSWPSEEASCHGTLATMTPGVNSSRPLRRRALWLCSTCSYHFPRTYSGM